MLEKHGYARDREHPGCLCAGGLSVGSKPFPKAEGDTWRPTIQYVARPPEMSNTAPVLNEHSRLASQQTSAATSSTSPKRSIGILERIYAICAGETCASIGVSIVAGVM